MQKLKKLFVLAAASVATSSAFAAEGTGVDLTALTSQIDFAPVIAGIMTVATALTTLYLARGGASTVLSFIRSKFG